MDQITFLSNICLLGAGLYIAKRFIDSRHPTPLPPGPTGWPVIGNLFHISRRKNWEDFVALGRIYGDILSISILGTRYVILNSSEAISGILEKQSIKCSDRPHLTMARNLAGFDKGLLFNNYNDRVRQYRKHISRSFGSKDNAATFLPIQEEETRRFLRNMLQKPDCLLGHIRSSTTAITLKATYGYTVQEGQDSLIELVDKIMTVVSQVAAPGAFLVDLIPAMRYLPEWFPGASFHKDAKIYCDHVIDSVVRLHKHVMEQMAAGTAIQSFSSTLLVGGVSPEEEDTIMWTCMHVYLAASDTVTYTIYAFFLAMLLFPDVQAKAQAELDLVVGSERLPSFNDRDSLPYVNAVCKEVFRWHSVAPLAMPHVATEDIHYRGFLIPKGSAIIGNAWAILHDESTYPDPSLFRPERFLGDTPQPDPHNVCFGFGRRICPGYRFGEASLFIAVAMSLAMINISKDVVNGVEITPKYDVSPGVVSYPMPFRYRITPRSARTEALLESDVTQIRARPQTEAV